MLWRAWQRRKRTGRRTSDLIEAGLRRDYGDAWLAVADDFDNAIAEWGQYIEGKMERRQRDYIDGVHESDEQRRKSAGKGQTVSGTKITREELEQIAEATWLYHVKDIVRRYLGDPSGKYDAVVWEKAATGDPMIDADWSQGEVTIRGVGATHAVRESSTMRAGD